MAKKKRGVHIPFTTIIFVIIPILVTIVALAKILTDKPDYVYAKVKVAQGLWWASNTKPHIWFTKAIRDDIKEYNLLGKPIAEILEVRYYQTEDKSIFEDEFDIYLTVKLSVDYNNRTKKYTYKRSNITVGTPISLLTPSVEITGTIMEVSEQEFDEKYVEKIVSITKKLAHPWEYDAIKIGDKYFDGQENVFEVLTKHQTLTNHLTSNQYGSTGPYLTESLRYITVKAKVKVRTEDNKLYFGEETTLNSGKPFIVSTDSYNFIGYNISKIE